jgi:hypothetical protein
MIFKDKVLNNNNNNNNNTSHSVVKRGVLQESATGPLLFLFILITYLMLQLIQI